MPGHRRPPGGIRTERCGRPAGRVGFASVREPRRGLGAPLLVAPVLGCGRDVEAAQPGSREGARRGLHGRNEQHLTERAVGGIAVDAPASVDRHPEITVGVHRQAIRRSNLRGHIDQHAAVGDRAPFAVERECMDHARAAVGEIHRAAVGAPAQSVRDRQPVEDQLGLSVPIEAVERSASDTVVIGQRARPEPALRIAGGVVHPGPGRGDVGEREQRAGRRQVGEAQTGGEQPPLVALDRRDCAHRSGHPIGANGNQIALGVDPIAVDVAGQDVHPQQFVPAGVPPGTFAELVLIGRAGNGVARHTAAENCTVQPRRRRPITTTAS